MPYCNKAPEESALKKGARLAGPKVGHHVGTCVCVSLAVARAIMRQCWRPLAALNAGVLLGSPQGAGSLSQLMYEGWLIMDGG